MFTYRIIKDYAVLMEYIYTSFEEEIIIPSTYTFEGREYPVQAIGMRAFSHASFGKVYIPNTVKVVSAHAFSFCHSLDEITIPSSVEFISNYAFAFSRCNIKIEKNSKIRVLGNNAFLGCKTKEIELPESLEIIGDGAFHICEFLEELSIPKNVSNIGDGIVKNCRNLKSITVDKENRYYDSRYNCNAIIEKERDVLIASCKNTTIPNDIKIIGTNSLYVKDLNEITIPKSVEIIEQYAFDSLWVKELILEGPLRLIVENKALYFDGPQVVYIGEDLWG